MNESISDVARFMCFHLQSWLKVCEEELKALKGENYESWKKDQFYKIIDTAPVNFKEL